MKKIKEDQYPTKIARLEKKINSKGVLEDAVVFTHHYLFTEAEIEHKKKQMMSNGMYKTHSLLRAWNPTSIGENKDENITKIKVFYLDIDGEEKYADLLSKFKAAAEKYNLDLECLEFVRSCSNRLHVKIKTDIVLNEEVTLEHAHALMKKISEAMRYEGLPVDKTFDNYLNHPVWLENMPIVKKEFRSSTCTKISTKTISYEELYERFKDVVIRPSIIKNTKTSNAVSEKLTDEEIKEELEEIEEIESEAADSPFNKISTYDDKLNGFLYFIDYLVEKHQKYRFKNIIYPCLCMAFGENMQGSVYWHLLKVLPSKRKDINKFFFEVMHKKELWSKFNWAKKKVTRKNVSWNIHAIPVLCQMYEGREYTNAEIERQLGINHTAVKRIINKYIAEGYLVVEKAKPCYGIMKSKVIKNNLITIEQDNEKIQEITDKLFSKDHRQKYMIRKKIRAISATVYKHSLTFKEIVDNNIMDIKTLEEYYRQNDIKVKGKNTLYDEITRES